MRGPTTDADEDAPTPLPQAVSVPRSTGAHGTIDPAGRRSERYRSDIEGMRAVAILLIVGYHAGVPGFSGGFIGVDVFFVISGYLITRNLLDQSRTTNRLDLPEFWARRIRRLVPGLGLMVAVTLVAALVIVAPFDMLRVSKEGAASALYISNIVFGNEAQNYFAPNINKSPFLHTWSLGVEEQFYLFWPFVVYATILLGRRGWKPRRRMTAITLASIFVASFALNVRWTGEGGTRGPFSACPRERGSSPPAGCSPPLLFGGPAVIWAYWSGLPASL